MSKLVSALLLGASLLLSAPVTAQSLIDFRDNRKVELTSYSDFHYTAKVASIGWHERNIGDAVNLASKALNDAVRFNFITNYGVEVVFDKVVLVTAADVGTMPSLIDPKNNKERGYLFYAPVTGEYQIRVSVPGGASAPRTTIQLFDSVNTTNSIINYVNVPNSSGFTNTFWVTLQKGVCGLKVTSSTATTVGYLDGVTLNNSTYLTWTFAKIPTCTEEHNLAMYLPIVGSTCVIPLVYPQNPTGPIYLDLSHADDGYFTISDPPYGGSYSEPLKGTYILGTYTIYGPPTQDDLDLIAGGPYGIHLAYTEMTAPTVNPLNRTIYFYFQRLPDFTSKWMYIVNLTPWPIEP